eukprot:362965-Chlamydomonas_euryale.AAC.10
MEGVLPCPNARNAEPPSASAAAKTNTDRGVLWCLASWSGALNGYNCNDEIANAEYDHFLAVAVLVASYVLVPDMHSCMCSLGVLVTDQALHGSTDTDVNGTVLSSSTAARLPEPRPRNCSTSSGHARHAVQSSALHVQARQAVKESSIADMATHLVFCGMTRPCFLPFVDGRV